MRFAHYDVDSIGSKFGRWLQALGRKVERIDDRHALSAKLRREIRQQIDRFQQTEGVDLWKDDGSQLVGAFDSGRAHCVDVEATCFRIDGHATQDNVGFFGDSL